MASPMSAESRELRGRIAGMSVKSCTATNARELVELRRDFAVSRLEDHIREVAAAIPGPTIAQITRLVSVLLDDGDGS